MAGYDPTKHHRRSIRLKGYDYTQAGAYFVTICVQERECLLGDVVDGEMRLNECGQIVETEWHGLPRRFPTIRLDEHQVMPNHVHFIVWLDPPPVVLGARLNRAPNNRAPTTTTNPIHGVITVGEPFTVDPERPTLGQIVRAFKAVTARRIHQAGMDFAWQRNYYEHIIRNEHGLCAIRQYIRNNPARWAEDRNNPRR